MGEYFYNYNKTPVFLWKQTYNISNKDTLLKSLQNQCTRLQQQPNRKISKILLTEISKISHKKYKCFVLFSHPFIFSFIHSSMAARGIVNLMPVSVEKPHGISFHRVPILVPVPTVVCMGSVLDVENGVTKTGLAVC